MSKIHYVGMTDGTMMCGAKASVKSTWLLSHVTCLRCAHLRYEELIRDKDKTILELNKAPASTPKRHVRHLVKDGGKFVSNASECGLAGFALESLGANVRYVTCVRCLQVHADKMEKETMTDYTHYQKPRERRVPISIWCEARNIPKINGGRVWTSTPTFSEVTCPDCIDDYGSHLRLERVGNFPDRATWERQRMQALLDEMVKYRRNFPTVRQDLTVLLDEYLELVAREANRPR
jgi:hypothetical protein